MIWEDVKKVGCAVKEQAATSAKGAPIIKTYVCCNYAPVGNIRGEFKNNVFIPEDVVIEPLTSIRGMIEFVQPEAYEEWTSIAEVNHNN